MMVKRTRQPVMRWRMLFACALSFATCVLARTGGADANPQPLDVGTVVARTIRPLMKQYGIPGMAVGVTLEGRHHVFDYGVASKTTGKAVDGSTLFEIGSITKTFTASLVSYAQLSGKLSLTDRVSADFPTLRGTSFDHVRLVDLGTHTAGGLPLQFPDDVRTDEDAIAYYRRWKPAHAAGTYRLYSNPSIMLLGLIAARRMNAEFTALIQRDLFEPLGLHNTFLLIPPDRLSHYAQGYTDDGVPKRMALGPLANEAYGIRTTAADMLQFLDANLNEVRLDDTLRRAIVDTHTGYDRVGTMTQDLIWEQLRYPVSLPLLLQANSDHMVFDENPVVRVVPPARPTRDAWLNKTGSTNGFAAYVAFIPARKIGIVLLANRSYPLAARVTAAYRILAQLDAAP